MNVLLDSERALYILNENYDDANKVNSRFKPGYFNTNEDLSYIKSDDIKSGNVLTVCGSGDHVFNSLLKGAEVVDTFDYNPFQYYIFELKKAAIMGLSKDDYLDFFPMHGSTIDKRFNIRYYDKIKDYLDDDSRNFWDTIYSNCSTPYKFYLFESIPCHINHVSDYTNSYDELKKLLNTKKISFYYSDICTLGDKVDNNYNVILLSNIYDHLFKYKKLSEEQYLDIVNNDFIPLLNDDGICFYHYQFVRSQYKSFVNKDGIEVGLDDVKVLRK